MPYMHDAWRQGLAAIDGEAKARYDGRGFAVLAETNRTRCCRSMQQRRSERGSLVGTRREDLLRATRFSSTCPALYYSHPKAWNEIGFGGPASPRGYVRLDGDRPDPWEAIEAEPGTGTGAERAEPACRLIPSPGAASQRAAVHPMSSDRARWVPMREYRETRRSRLRHRRHRCRRRHARRAAGRAGLLGHRLRCRAPISGRSRILPPTKRSRTSYTGPTRVSSTARTRSRWAAKIRARRWAARPSIMRWCRCASGPNGSSRAPRSATARTGRSRWEEMWHYYGEAERQINISGPLTYPWGPKRPRYPYRAHELNDAGKLLAKGCEAIGIDWTETPLATLSAPHAGPEGKSPPCAYRGFCRFGCTTNAKRSALTVWIPRALAAGAEVRDLAMVGRIETGPDGRATGVHYHREGGWHFPAREECRRGGLCGRDTAPTAESANQESIPTASPTVPGSSART